MGGVCCGSLSAAPRRLNRSAQPASRTLAENSHSTVHRRFSRLRRRIGLDQSGRSETPALAEDTVLYTGENLIHLIGAPTTSVVLRRFSFKEAIWGFQPVQSFCTSPKTAIA